MQVKVPSSFIFWLLQVQVLLALSLQQVACALSLNTPTAHDTLRREQRWGSAVATLENSTTERRRFDHRAHLARLVGIYVGDSEVKHHSIHVDSKNDAQKAKILVAIQPDQGGRKLLFLDADDGRSMGFIELETQSATSKSKILERPPSLIDENEIKTSALRGMLVADHCQGQGYARIFLAIWLRLCLTAGVTPATTRINKPLLALTLVRLGFTPLRGHHLAQITNKNHLRGGIRTNHLSKGKPPKRRKLKEKHRPLAVEVSVGTEGRVLLYSPLSNERLRNGFSVQEVKSQHLVVANEPSVPRGRIAHLRVRYAPPRHMISVNDDNTVPCALSDRHVSQQMVHLPLAEGVAGRLRLSATQGPARGGRLPSTSERAEAMHLLTGRI